MIRCFGKLNRNLTKEVSTNHDSQNLSSTQLPGDSNKKSSSKASNSEKEHSFLRAAHNGQFGKVKEAIEANMDVNSCNSNGLNALHLAAKGGHIEIVQYLISKGADIHAKTRKNNTALHIASLAGSFDVVRLLVEHGANVNDQSQNGFTPLYMAAQENHVWVVKYLLDHGADINLSTSDEFTPLAVAIQQGNEETVSVLLKKANEEKLTSVYKDAKLPPLHIATKKDDYNAVLLLLHHESNLQEALTQTSANGFTALHLAAYYGSEKVGRLLLENGSCVDSVSKNNITPLHVATKRGQLGMVKLLIEYHANINMPTRDGIRPIHCAAREGYKDICMELIDNGADFNAKTQKGLTSLHMVAQGNQEHLVDYFVKVKGADVNEPTLDYLTPLHFSSHCNSVAVGKELIKRGAHVNQRAMNGFVALHIATKQDHMEFIEMLISNSCALDTQTEDGLTALHIASIIGSEGIIQLLLNSKCEVDIVDQYGRTPVHMAVIFDMYNITVNLVEHGAQINKQNKNGETPLIIAIKRQNQQMVQYLLNEEAQLSIPDYWGISPLMWSILLIRECAFNTTTNVIDERDSHTMFNIIRTHCNSGDINHTTKKGISCLHIAAECGNLDAVHFLMEMGAMPDCTTSKGLTPLHLASKNNHSDIIMVLLKSMNETSIDNCFLTFKWSPLHYAAYFGSVDALKCLLQNGSADDNRKRLEQRTPEKNTCLHLAIQQFQVEIIKLLLEYNSDPNLKNCDGLDCFDFVQLVNDEPITQMFLEKFQFQTTMNNENVDTMKREEAIEDEHLEKLFSDSTTEMEFYGANSKTFDRCDLHYSILSLLDYTSINDSIRRIDWSLKINDSLSRFRNVALVETKRNELLIPAQPSSMFSTLSSTVSEMDGFDVEKSNYRRITDKPISSGFLTSFLVDARGGCMQTQRYPQIKIYVPPDAAPAPTRIIFHLIKPENMSNLPGVNDCDGFASRILQVQSSCQRFQKPVLIEMPHIASLRNGEREIVIMRRNYDSQSWKEHSLSLNEDTLKEAFGTLYETLTSEEQLKANRLCRIATYEVPAFFCLVSRFQRNLGMIGPDGGTIEAKSDKRIKLRFPQGALMKKIQINLEVQNIDPTMVNRVLGENHNAVLSPIITVEPKRRKFRDMIEIQMPLPKVFNKSDLNSLRLLFSITEYDTKWEDVTESTELVITDDVVSHSTKISARVWLVSTPGYNPVDLANRIYSIHSPTPYIGRFLAFARRHEEEECQLRCMLITDDSSDKTLECQERFELVATGPDIELTSKLDYQVEAAGNIVPVTKSDEPIKFFVQAFIENRLTIPFRIRNSDSKFCGKVAFIPYYNWESKQKLLPVTTLEINVPDEIVSMEGTLRKPEKKKRVKDATIERIKGCNAIAKSELNLKEIADKLGCDWYTLAAALGLDAEDINLVLNEKCTEEDKAFMTLIQWQNIAGDKATGNALNKALRSIGREDVIKSCLRDISFVVDEAEMEVAKTHLIDKPDNYDANTWGDLLDAKNNAANIAESIDESMIVETGDEWSDRHHDEKEISDESDKSEILENSASETDSVKEADIVEIVDPEKYMQTDPVSSAEKTAAFLDIINQLDQILPEPELLESVNSYEVTIEPDESRVSLPLSSCLPSHMDFDDDEELIVSKGVSLNFQPYFGGNNEAVIKQSYSKPIQSSFQNKPNESYEDVSPHLDSSNNLQYNKSPEEDLNKRKDIDDEAANEEELTNSSVLEETASATGKHSVLHEILETEPEVEVNVEEYEEEMPDGSIVKRKVIRKKTSKAVTERTIRELSPEEYEKFSKDGFKNPEEVIETEEILPDGSVLRRKTVHEINTLSMTKTLKTVSGNENDPNSVVETDETLPDGTVVRRRITVHEINTTTVTNPTLVELEVNQTSDKAQD